MSRTNIQLTGAGVAIAGDHRPLVRPPAANNYPLVVAIHGGTYTGRYFDVEGASLLTRASHLGIPIVAVDRPCYGHSGGLEPENATILNSAKVLNAAMEDLWQRYAEKTRGIFLIGHSIGAAVAILMASMKRGWPLLGIAISGLGMRPPLQVSEQWRELPSVPTIHLLAELKDLLMFGPPETYLDDVRARAHAADYATPRSELQDIVFAWPDILTEACARVEVPVHYRQPEFDNLWVVNEKEVQAFKNCFTASPFVDAALLLNAGHCIDLHHAGGQFQLQQLNFALRCSAA